MVQSQFGPSIIQGLQQRRLQQEQQKREEEARARSNNINPLGAVLGGLAGFATGGLALPALLGGAAVPGAALGGAAVGALKGATAGEGARGAVGAITGGIEGAQSIFTLLQEAAKSTQDTSDLTALQTAAKGKDKNKIVDTIFSSPFLTKNFGDAALKEVLPDAENELIRIILDELKSKLGGFTGSTSSSSSNIPSALQGIGFNLGSLQFNPSSSLRIGRQ